MFCLALQVIFILILLFQIVMEHTLEQLRYPIGKFQKPEEFSDAGKKEWIAVLDALPDPVDLLGRLLCRSCERTLLRAGDRLWIRAIVARPLRPISPVQAEGIDRLADGFAEGRASPDEPCL